MRPHCNINDINVFCLAFAMAKCPNVQIEIKKRKKNFWQFGTIQRGKRIITSRISKQMVQYFTSHKSWDLIFPFRMLLLAVIWVPLSLARSFFLNDYCLNIFDSQWIDYLPIAYTRGLSLLLWGWWWQQRRLQWLQQQWMWNTLTNWTFIRFIDFLTTSISFEMENSAFRSTV